MGFTNFPSGITSLGMPVIPGIGGGIFSPQSKSFFVAPGHGGSDGHDGRSIKRPLATVSKALSLCTADKGDTVYLIGDGNTSGTSREDSTIVWSKDNTHLIGITAPTMVNGRARISHPSDQATVVTPMLTVSGDGCVIANVSLFEGVAEATAGTCVLVTGRRNYFWNVAMMNMGDATGSSPAGVASSETLDLFAANECTFDNCYIGLDTIARTAANTHIRLRGGAKRCIFRDCFFSMHATGSGSAATFMEGDSANSIDRWIWFKNCVFSSSTTSTATVAEVANIHANANGTIIFDDCNYVGDITAWESVKSNNVYTSRAASVAAGGKMVAAV